MRAARLRVGEIERVGVKKAPLLLKEGWPRLCQVGVVNRPVGRNFLSPALSTSRSIYHPVSRSGCHPSFRRRGASLASPFVAADAPVSENVLNRYKRKYFFQIRQIRGKKSIRATHISRKASCVTESQRYPYSLSVARSHPAEQ